jgi:Zn-dependent protease
MLWALGQPAAVIGLGCAFLIGLGLRVLAQRLAVTGAALPVPPLDGYRLLRVAWGGHGADLPPPAAADRLGVLALLLAGVIPLHGSTPLLTVLDAVGTPLLGVWT